MPVTVAIEGLNHQGEGIGRNDGQVIFIPYALPQETVTVEILRQKNHYARGRIIEILEPAPQRAVPPCPYYYHCGGCAYQHTSYAHQLHFKTEAVKNTLQRIGGLDTVVEPAWGMDNPWHYRNKVSWQAGYGNSGEETRPALGYYQKKSHRFLPITYCRLLGNAITDISLKAAELLSRQSHLPKSVIVRQSASGQDTLIAGSGIETTLYENLAPTIVKIKQDQTYVIKGKGYIEEEMAGIHFQLAPLAFFQVNHRQTLRIIQYLELLIKSIPQAKILDAYCGVGALALPLARQVREIIGVDSYRPAITSAVTNAKINHLENCSFYAGACEDVFSRLDQDFDLILLDPPRSGCHSRLLAAVNSSRVEKIVYISCNPATLARDLKILTGGGYQVRRVQPLDMFPWTHHVETVVLLQR